MNVRAADDRSILLVEDQARTRKWLTQVIERAFPACEIIACEGLAAGFEALAAMKAEAAIERLWLAVIDLNLPDGSGVDLIREISTDWPDATAIVATVYDDDAHLLKAIAAGAGGYLLKGEPKEVLVDCLKRLAAGEPAMSPSIAHRILAQFREMAQQAAPAAPPPHQQALSPRETEVLTLLARGLTVAETARKLELSSQTVATYVRTIYSKLSVTNRAQAVLEARRRGLR